MNKSIALIPRRKLNLLLALLRKLAGLSNILGLQTVFKTSLLLIIRAYKQYISPYKGFACAYRVLHQEQSCSSYFQTCIREQRFDLACISFQQRLAACHQANITLQASASSQHRQKNRRRRKRKNSCAENNNCLNCRDMVDPGLLFTFCNPFDCLDCGDCDF